MRSPQPAAALARPALRLATIAGAVLLAGCASDRASSGDSAEDRGVVPIETAGAAPEASAGRPSDTAAVRACAATVITGDSVGPLRIGATVEDVGARCTVVRDTTRPGAEGMPARMIAVVLGADTVEAEIVDGRVWRVPVTTSGLRTADGLGVGTPLSRLLELRDVRPAMGEGTYVLAPSHCGLSFQLANPGGSLPPATTVEQLRRLPGSTVVSRVLVTGCSR